MRRPQTPRPLPINKDGSNGAARGAAKSAQPRQRSAATDASAGPAKTGSAASSRQRRESSRQPETSRRRESGRQDSVRSRPAPGRRPLRSEAAKAPSKAVTRTSSGVVASAKVAEASLASTDDHVVSHGLQQRYEEQRAANRKRSFNKLKRLVYVLVALALVVWVALASPLFALRMSEIRVSGSGGQLSPASVAKVIGDQEGRSLLLIDVAKQAKRVDKAFVRVRSVSIERDWPRGLNVMVTMRVPVAVLKTAKGYQILDADAVVLETRSSQPSGLALIESSGKINSVQVQSITTAMGALDESVRSQVASASATESGYVSFKLSSGASVIWGDNDRPALKARVLKTLLSIQASVYDVSYPLNPTTKK